VNADAAGGRPATTALRARSHLYVPADRPELIDKALASAADVVVLDLEDAVAAKAKDAARDVAVATIDSALDKPVVVRVNRPDSPAGRADVAALREHRPAAVRLPKCESPELVAQVASALTNAAGPVPVICLIESALGLERAYALATAAPAVAGLTLGEADLAGELGTSADEGLQYARSRCVAAARAAGLPAPVQSVFPRLRDPDGLRASCAAGRALGFFGRSAIHPEQIEAIHAVYTPTREELARAREIVARQDECGGGVLADGAYVDEGVASAARALLALADDLGLEVPQ